MTSEERRVRIPYKLGTDHYCTYEDDGEDSYVRMGDMVTIGYDTRFGQSERSGELNYVKYDWEGYIDSVTLFPSGEPCEVEVYCPGDMVFYRMEDGHAID